MRERVAILGAGPHGRAIEALPGVDWVVYDDNPEFNLEPIDWGARAWPWIIGAAWPWVRREVDEKLLDRLPLPGDLKEPKNRGIIKLKGAQVSLDESQSGKHVHICQNAIVSHGCILGDYVTVAPGAILCGDVKVGAGTLIGAGAVVLHTGITIGDNAIVGAGAVVLEDVPSNVTVVGNPARAVARSDQGFR